MVKVIDKNKNKVENQMNTLRSKDVQSLAKFVRTRGVDRSGITTDVNGGALVPSGLTNVAEDLSDRKFQLAKYVNFVPVQNNKGDMPVMNPSAVAYTKDELAKYPELNNEIQTVPYKINTYAGKLSISNELLEDTSFPISMLLSKQLGTVSINTKNKAIADEMNKVKASSISSLDDLINAIGTIDPRFQKGIYMDQKSYSKIRTMKDRNGDYIVNETANTLLNIPITVLPAYLGLSGIFIGDLQTAISLFDRNETSFEYNMNNVFGTALCAVLRFDAELTYAPALVHLSFNDASAAK